MEKLLFYITVVFLLSTKPDRQASAKEANLMIGIWLKEQKQKKWLHLYVCLHQIRKLYDGHFKMF